MVARHATIGELIQPEDEQPAFIVSDITELWVNASLYERDLSRVHEGQRAVVTTPAYPGRSFAGRVSLISTALEEQTRTAKARIVVKNPDLRLKPEMFANIKIALGSRPTLAIPSSAVMQEKGETFVFTKQSDTTFERRPVQVGAPAGGFVPVESGLKAGETVVTDGAFTLKAELLKESFGEHEH
ncbi:Cobalt-zinc-cadmium resistance protein CzcB [compost metagenome]